MTEIVAVQSVTPTAASVPSATQAPAALDFASMLRDGLHQVEVQVNNADALVRAFAVDDSVPVHQVTIALEQARLSVELALQVRTKLVDALHEIMTMQL